MDLANGSLNADERNAPLAQAAQAIAKAEDALNAAPAAALSAAPPQRAQTAVLRVLQADSEASEKYPPPRIPLVPMTPLSTQETSSALFFQFAAAGLGILAAWAFNLQLLDVFAHPDPVPAFFPVLDKIFTGLVIGGGSQPVHLLIRFITERKVAPEAAPAG